MNERDSREWITDRWGSERTAKLATYVDLLVQATTEQNLIATSTVPNIWSRHILDSAQLLTLAPDTWAHWTDIGSGAGLPGLVIATLAERNVTLIEPRPLRTQFLRNCIDVLELANVAVVQGKAGTADVEHTDVISARAVAPLTKLLDMTQPFTSPSTTFILPKGRSAQSEVAQARQAWQGSFHVEQSIVDASSGIVVATDVRRWR